MRDGARCESEGVLKARWESVFRALQVPAPPTSKFTELLARYSEPHRAYHTVTHLADCFAMLDRGLATAERPAEVELALWFHDAIYDPRAKDNEAQSAALADAELASAAVPAEARARVVQLILVTAHDGVPEGADAELLIDVDLSILGSEPERFDVYETEVRREYSFVPLRDFCAGRSRILASFLARPTIFTTAGYRKLLEARARENLERSIARLTPRDAPR